MSCARPLDGMCAPFDEATRPMSRQVSIAPLAALADDDHSDVLEIIKEPVVGSEKTEQTTRSKKPHQP